MDELVSEHWQIHADQGPGSANTFFTKREGCTGKILVEILTVRTECSELRTKKTEGRYSACTAPIIDWKKKS